MIKNFLRLTFRNLIKRKGFAILNISGLAIGMICCLLIFEYVSYERSYDNFHEKADRIFRVQDENYQNGRLVVACAAAMPGVAPAMMREFPELEDACRFVKIEFLLGNDARNISFIQSSAYYADEPVLRIFHLPLVEGDAATALDGPGKIILSKEEARRYFGEEDPIGKILTIHRGRGPLPLKVTGVFADYPSNSHVKFSVLVSYQTYGIVTGTAGSPKNPLETSFDWTDFYTYILLKKGVDPKTVEAKIPAFIDKHYNSLPENKVHGDSYTLSLMPLKNIHLESHYTEEAEPTGDGQSVTFLFLIALFIIGIAWINYINLGTARSLDRAREVGMRKVLGALKAELIGQFMMESLVLNLIALVLAVLLVLAINPVFGRLTGRPLPLLFNLSAGYWLGFFGLFLAGTFLSGFYPALVMSRYRPVAVLKGLFSTGAKGSSLRKGLIIVQFTASIILIGGTIIVYKQIQYMRSHELGANINQTLIIRGAGSGMNDSTYQDIFRSFRQEVLGVKGVKSLTASSGIMGKEILWSTDWYRFPVTNSQAVNLFHLGVDDDYIASYGLKVIAGRSFSPDYGNERKAIIINQSAVKALGLPSPEAAIGIMLTGGQRDMDSMQVVGVIADYHNEGLQKPIQPLVLLPHRDRREYYSVKYQDDKPSALIASIKKIWDGHFHADPYSYFFLDEFFNRQYEENRRFGEVFALFALLAITIACFGLLGLSAFNVLQRTREIGIRKVLGASVQSLLFVLSKEFLLLVMVAFVVAIPITWMVMHQWLQGFAYRIQIGWWIFLLAGVLSAVVALMTVGYQALKAALANPVNSLRTE
jgi:putative ABC transport system permease protein